MRAASARPTATLAALAAAGLLAGGTAGPAAAAARGHARAPGVFSISPAEHELTGRPGEVLTPTLVGNTTGIPLSVRVVPVLLHQSRSGAFQFSTAPRALRAARRVLAVSTAGFTLAGDARHTVLERWQHGAGNHAVYAGVIFRADLRRRTSGVRTVEQLLEVDLMAMPGSAPARGRIAAVSVADGAPHRLSFTVGLRNVGRTFGTPTRVGVVVRSRTGRILARAPMTPDVILPGVTRDFVGLLPRRLPRGALTAVASATLDGRVVTRVLHLRVTAGGELPAPSLVPGGVRVRGQVGGDAEVTIPVRNRGTRAGAPRGAVALYVLHGAVPASHPLAEVRITGPSLASGATRRLRVAIGHLHAGAYQAVVRYATPFVPAQPALLDFTPRPTRSAAAVAWRWLTAHLAELALGLALLVSLGYSVRRTRRAAGAPAGVRLRPPS